MSCLGHRFHRSPRKEAIAIIPSTTVQNRLLHALPAKDFATLQPDLERVSLTRATVLAERGTQMTHFYFPETCLLSLVVSLEAGDEIETGVIGREGMLGAQALLSNAAESQLTVVQVPGEALRIPFATVRKEFDRRGTLAAAVGSYVTQLISLIAQSAACQNAHSVSQRCARWLLMVEDGVGSSTFSLTHEYLATMLGVRRAGVSTVAANFQKAGLIHYHRGRMEILDRRGLETVACECYEATRSASGARQRRGQAKKS